MLRFLFVILVFGGLTLFALQNTSPSLPLVFLGIRTQALPLSLWMLMAIALGSLTTLTMTTLLGLSGYLSARTSRRQFADPSGKQRRDRPQPTKPFVDPASSNTQPQTNRSTASNYRDDRFDAEDDFVEDSPQDRSRDFDRTSTAKNSAPDDSGVYSYSYKEPTNSGVGRREAVYDADYRVINPPYQTPEAYQASDDDDWGFDDDDDFLDEPNPKSKF